MQSPTQPSIGRIIIYVPKPESIEATNGATEIPGIINLVHSGEEFTDSNVGATVFPLSGPGIWRSGIKYDEENTPGTWHWPPRI